MNALLSTIKPWVQTGYGTCDEDTLLDVINAIRREWYSWYQTTTLFIDVEECFEVQNFCEDCRTCAVSYRGITLPREYGAVEAMWWQDAPVALFDRWRQWQKGMAYRDCGLEKHVMADNFPTERDILPRRPRKLKVVALSWGDSGKSVILKFRDIDGREVTETLALDGPGKPVFTENVASQISRPSGVIKQATNGAVLLGCDDGRILSIYAPDETLPQYQRIKITGLPSSCEQVFIRAARMFAPVFDDNHVVESDNQLAWEKMAQAVKIGRKPARDANEIRAESANRIQAREMLLGDKSRAIGKSTQASLNIKSPNFGNHALTRTRR